MKKDSKAVFVGEAVEVTLIGNGGEKDDEHG
jgi:hypothetical protein